MIENPYRLKSKAASDPIFDLHEIKGYKSPKEITFANNIIAAGNGYCTEDTLNHIIVASLNDKPEIETDMAFSDVIKMVVPY